jgi:polar amino acid transport system permease protein
MSYAQRMRRVVLPQAARVIIPPTGNDFIAMMKDTALVAFLGVTLERADLFRRAQLIGNQDLRNLEALMIAAGMYWLLTAIFTFFQARLERRLSAGYVRTEVRAGTGKKRTQYLPAGPPGSDQPVADDIELDLRGGNVPGHEHGGGGGVR